MTTVTFTLTSEPPTIPVGTGRRDGVNALFVAGGPFTVTNRNRIGNQWTVTLDGDLNAGQKTGLQTSLEASGHCTDVAFP